MQELIFSGGETLRRSSVNPSLLLAGGPDFTAEKSFSTPALAQWPTKWDSGRGRGEVVSEEHGGRTAWRPMRGAALQRMTSLPTASDSWGPSHENWQGKTDLFKQGLSLSSQQWLMFNTGVQPGSRAIAWVSAFQDLAEVQMAHWVTDHTEPPHPQAGFHCLWVWFLFLLVCLCLPLLCVLSCTLWTHTLWIFNFIKPWASRATNGWIHHPLLHLHPPSTPGYQHFHTGPWLSKGSQSGPISRAGDGQNRFHFHKSLLSLCLNFSRAWFFTK